MRFLITIATMASVVAAFLVAKYWPPVPVVKGETPNAVLCVGLLLIAGVLLILRNEYYPKKRGRRAVPPADRIRDVLDGK